MYLSFIRLIVPMTNKFVYAFPSVRLNVTLKSFATATRERSDLNSIVSYADANPAFFHTSVLALDCCVDVGDAAFR